jgi:hypothetical protein
MSHEIIKVSKYLINRYNLNETQITFIKMIMVPKAFRRPKDYICGKLGLSHSIYYSWLRNPDINKARKELMIQYFKDDVADILYAMKNEALAGNERAARLFLEYVDDFDKNEDPGRGPMPMPRAEVNITIEKLTQKFYGTNRPKNCGPIEGSIVS